MRALLVYFSIGEALLLACLMLSRKTAFEIAKRGPVTSFLGCLLFVFLYPLVLFAVGWKGARS